MTGARALLVWSFAVIVALILGAWLGGMIFFQIAGLDLDKATPLSLVQYWPYRDLSAWKIGAGAPVLLFGGLLAAALWPKPEKVHGDAKWAREPDIARAGLRAKVGILLGKKGGRFLISEAAAHTLLVAPTRSGKGVGVIVPNLLNFDGSAVVLDIKFENFDITAGFRAEHGAVFLWSPMAPEGRSHRYNPLHEVRSDPAFRVTDLQLVASYLIPLPEKNPVWEQLARSLFTGLCLYVMDDPESEPTIGAIYRTLNRTGAVDFTDWVVELVENAPRWLDPECDRLLSAYAAMTAKERAFVRTSLNAALNLWSSPLVDAATAATDFELGDLRRRRMSVYVGVTHSQMSALRPLLSLFFQQVIAALSERQPGSDEPHKVLILLDEFASLGKMESIASAVTMLAGYGGRLMFVLQGLGTLEENYGRAGGDVIVQNCANQIFFAPNDETTARYVVARLGRKTVRQESKSRFKGGVSRQTSDTGRDLMMPQELRGLDRSKEIVLVEGAPPILADKITYYRNAAFTARLRDDPPVPMLDTAGRGGSAVGSHIAPEAREADTPSADSVERLEEESLPPPAISPEKELLAKTNGQLNELAELLDRNGVDARDVHAMQSEISAFDREG